MAERSPEDVLAGILRIAVGGVEKIVPTLPIRANREWQAGLADGPTSFAVPSDDDWTPSTVSTFTSLTLDAVLDIVVAYDRTGALGGREWLEENADPAQLYAAATQMGEVAFPFATDIPTVLAALVVRQVIGSKPRNSTNGPSAIGDLRRKPSRRPSTQAS